MKKIILIIALILVSNAAALALVTSIIATYEGAVDVHGDLNVAGYATDGGGTGFGLRAIGLSGLYGYATTSSGAGVTGSSEAGIGVFGNSGTGMGVFGKSESGTGVSGASTSGTGVIGNSSTSYGVYGHSSSATGGYFTSDSNYAVYGSSSNITGDDKAAVYGGANNANGVWGVSDALNGVRASSNSSAGLRADSKTGNAIYAVTTDTNNTVPTIYAYQYGTGDCIYAAGNVRISGTLSKTAGLFLIDHPLDPKNKVLRHSFVESPDMKNIYDGIAALDRNGEAAISLPSYFEALNRDYRYQWTSIGGFAPVYIKEKVKGNKFVIAGGKAGLEVSWQVTGIRQDAYAQKHPMIVEEEKGKDNKFKKGVYLNPESFVK